MVRSLGRLAPGPPDPNKHRFCKELTPKLPAETAQVNRDIAAAIVPTLASCGRSNAAAATKLAAPAMPPEVTDVDHAAGSRRRRRTGRT